MYITKQQIRRDYPHRIKTDGTGKYGCPVCCGDGDTMDPAYGGKVVREIDGIGKVRECLACPVWHEED